MYWQLCIVACHVVRWTIASCSFAWKILWVRYYLSSTSPILWWHKPKTTGITGLNLRVVDVNLEAVSDYDCRKNILYHELLFEAELTVLSSVPPDSHHTVRTSFRSCLSPSFNDEWHWAPKYAMKRICHFAAGLENLAHWTPSPTLCTKYLLAHLRWCYCQVGAGNIKTMWHVWGVLDFYMGGLSMGPSGLGN